MLAGVLLFNTTGYAQQTNPLVIGRARFTVIAPELIRMEYSADGAFLDDSTLFAVNRSARTDSFEIKRVGNRYDITTRRMQVHFVDTGAPFSPMNLTITVNAQPKNYEWKAFVSQDDKNLGGTVSTLDGVRGAIPTDDGLLSRNGWKVIDDSNQEIVKNGWVAERPVSHLKDLYFFAYGSDYKAALRALTRLSGTVPMTRKYVHGSWYCRWWDYSAEEYRDIVKGYREHDFPLDVMVLDMGWHTQKDATTGMGHANMFGWTGYTWNKQLFPAPAALLGELKKDHLFIALNDHPADGIRHHEDAYPAFMAAMAADTSGKKELLFDAGSKRYMTNFFRYSHVPHERAGVDFWWLDWQQDHLLPHVQGYRTLKHMPWLNYLYYSRSRTDGQRGLMYSRWAGWGSQRMPIQFSGDAISTWEMLKFQVPFTATSGNAGCFFWAHDVGGFRGERNPEMYVRWTQFALTTSSLRIHSARGSTLDRRPWLWGKQAEDAMRRIYHLRSQLMPYTYSSVRQCHEQSVPLNRALYLDYPRNEAAYANPQEFLYGDLLLSAPIVSPGKGESLTSSQRVWFPEGDTWYSIFDNSQHEGGQTAEISADINSFPLFVKGGYPLPMQPYRSRMATAPLDTLVVRVYPGQVGKTNTYQLYEDDGVTEEYTRGRYATTELRYTQAKEGATLRIEPAAGKGYQNQPPARVYRIEFPAVKVSKASVNQKKAAIQRDTASRVDYVLVKATSINKAVSVVVKN
ncbi:TIM-barrel domain-containing protein [Hymenobacter sp.]|uniref:glycoside hydrolase family 31 protein n=1 Tax=Hymenobacter sp. TaxID=1898978 RepID=UPI00286AEB31|nr:TIM-barrel domain-containing protein [Hymenobacter sp.]